MSDASLSERDRRVVRDAYAELEASAPPTVLPPALAVGAVLGGGLLLAVWLAFRDRVPGASFLTPFVMLFGVLSTLSGVFALTMAFRGKERAYAVAGDAALGLLAEGGEDRETRLRAAVLLVCSRAGGSEGFDPVEIATRLGPGLPLVASVERLLAEECGIDPLLTGPYG